MKRLPFLLIFLAGSWNNSFSQDEAAINPGPASAKSREGVVQIDRDMDQPSVAAIARIDQSNVFFLDHDGQVGVAKFSPGLSLLAWDYYSRFQWSEARHLAVGRNLSVVSGSPHELTQAFDTDQDGSLDFFQDTIVNWPGKGEGATISCGPVTDNFGRLLFGVSPSAESADADAVCTLFAWNPGGKTLTALATSSLPIVEMTISPEGMLAAWIQLPSYDEGYYIALSWLPPFDPDNPDHQPIDPPALLPNIIIPASLTDFKPISKFCFSKEDGKTKIFITCPQSNRLIEVVPERGQEGDWGGTVSVRQSFPDPIYAIESMDEGKVLLGGTAGFAPLSRNLENFRFLDVRLVSGWLEIAFTKPVDRAKATETNAGVQLAIIPLEGQLEPFDPPRPIVESDGRTVLLKLPPLPGKAILKIDAPGLTCENGEAILFPSFFYTMK